MLRSLKIRNLALVEELSWDLPSGFVAVTGETGAGKSIILGALKFLIGERADRGLVRRGASSATIEAVFHFKNLSSNSTEAANGFVAPVLEASSSSCHSNAQEPSTPRPSSASATLKIGSKRSDKKLESLNEFLEEHGIDPCHEGELILRRSISLEATGRQFVNGSPCNLVLLRELGERLVDLHGPHDHQSLFSRTEQTFLLDGFSGSLNERENYLSLRKKFAGLVREEEELKQEVGDAHFLEQLKREVEEISLAQLDITEEENLFSRHRAAAHGKRLLELSSLAVARLNDDEVSVSSVVAEVTRLLRELARLDSRAEEELQEMETISEKLQELTHHLSDYSDKIELDQGELQQIEERLDLLATLKRKYGLTLEAVIARGEESAQRLELLSTSQERMALFAASIEKARQEMLEAMAQLTILRKKGALKLATAIGTALGDLGFRQAGFEIALEPLPEPTSDGGEQADFLFAPNPGEAMQPLRMIASSGEISRVMLALKSVVAAQDRIPLLVFDEIDANVGGEIASKVGAKMKALAKDHQVLCITHLPQVAAAAGAQVVVQKEVHDGRTSTTLATVEGSAREEEIARMLGGASDSALAHARVLLGN
ncbi:MAG: hypothetical protein A3F67_01760 [Verrucomicrobia bacterium RIFCSPHIGHO2_12_FULL_41_10]|nr:MAG: hypothetical protein A3F67_01760 [Verrucomicrobia bacterium RIFCSPHIGHO2_12_FULL_41_10]